MLIGRDRDESTGRYVAMLLEVRDLQTCFVTAGETIRAVDGISYDVHAHRPFIHSEAAPT